MISFKEYYEQFIESFDSPAKIKKRNIILTTKDKIHTSFFSINNKTFFIEIEENLMYSIIHVVFGRYENKKQFFGVYNDLTPKEVLSVFSTIYKEVKRFATKEVIYFSSVEPDKLSIYKKMTKKLISKDRVMIVDKDDITIVKKDMLLLGDKVKLFIDNSIEKILKAYKKLKG